MAANKRAHLPFRCCDLSTLLLLLSVLSSVIGDPRPDLPFIGCAAPEGNTQRCYFYVQEEKTWDEADKACRSHKGAYLATVPDYQTRIFLSEAARPRQNGVWIGGVKEEQHSWRWNTGRPYLHKVVFNRTEPDAELCGYINSENATVIQTTPCTTKLKYICSESELTSIHDPHYVSPYRHWIWYSAKIDCLNRGMDLAVVKDDNLDIIRQLLEAEVEHEEDPRYWVGLSTSKYIWANNGKEMDHILFSCGEPSHSSERCIEMLADSKYNDTRCEEKRPYICEWVKKGHEMFDIGCLDTRCFYYVEEAMNWKDANRTCRQYSDTFLATIPDYHTQFYLNSMVTKLYLTKRKDQSAIMGRTDAIENGFWVGGHNIFYDKWRFMTGDLYLGVVKQDPFEDNHCATVIPGDNAIHGLICNYRRRFVCLTTDPKADVLRAENHFISSAQTQVLNWFKARTNCLDRGMELASGSMELLQQVLTGETGSFWVGLTKSRFIWEHTGNPIDHLTFRCGEPNNYKGYSEHCVEMWLDGEYNDNICTEPKSFVCEFDRAPVTLSSTKPPYFTSKPTEHQECRWMYTAISLAIVGLAIIFLSFSVNIYMYKVNSTLRKKLVPMDVETTPEPIATVELENQDDPTLDDLLSPGLSRRLLNAVANGIYKNLRLCRATKLWAILEVNGVVDHVTKEEIQNNNKTDMAWSYFPWLGNRKQDFFWSGQSMEWQGNNNSKTNVEQVAGLFDHLRRGTNRRYYYFRAALLKADYDAVVRNYLDDAPGSPHSAALVTPTPSSSHASPYFQFPPTTPNPRESHDSIEDGPSSSSSTKQSTCQSDSPTSSAWTRGGRFIRGLLPDPSRSHMKKTEESVLTETDTKDKDSQV